jgi:hypothetical protein
VPIIGIWFLNPRAFTPLAVAHGKMRELHELAPTVAGPLLAIGALAAIVAAIRAPLDVTGLLRTAGLTQLLVTVPPVLIFSVHARSLDLEYLVPGYGLTALALMAGSYAVEASRNNFTVSSLEA